MEPPAIERVEAVDVATLTNGTQVAIERRQGTDEVAMAWIVNTPQADLRRGHGATAIVARALADQCWNLDTRGRSQVTAIVEAHRIGALLVVPRDEFYDAADALLRCVLRRTIPDRTVEAARLAATQGAREAGDAPLWVARLLFPEIPGKAAPLGHPETILRIPARRIQRRFHDLLRGAAMEVRVVGDLDPTEVVGFLARRLLWIPASDPVPPPAAPPAPDPNREAPVLLGTGRGAWKAIGAWQAGPGSAPGTAAVCAEAIAKTLRRRGHRVLHWTGGSGSLETWVSVVLATPTSALADLATWADVDPAKVLEAIRTVHGEAQGEAVRRATSPARRAAEEPFPPLKDTETVCGNLLSSKARWGVVRPQVADGDD
ncbi:MAG: insulinase family protein [Myxococcales bacterium]|nr:insulinase family protein [Myxococcales bacterium]